MNRRHRGHKARKLTTDGTKVNTTGGWREMKRGIFSKRGRGEPATPEQWESRTLPRPKVRMAFAAIEQNECRYRAERVPLSSRARTSAAAGRRGARETWLFGTRWRRSTSRETKPQPEPTALGCANVWDCRTLRQSACWPTFGALADRLDGARRIREKQRQHRPGADGVLDSFPAWQHLSDLSKTLHADEAGIAAWTDQARTTLLASGWPGIEELFEQDPERRSGSQQAAVGDLRYDLANHQHHLNDAERLARGQSIGSGQVEGGCKNMINRRLKQTGARWCVRHVNRMAGPCSLMDSHQWKTDWQTD